MSNVGDPVPRLGFKAIGLLLLTILCFDVMSILVRILSADYSAQELSQRFWHRAVACFVDLHERAAL